MDKEAKISILTGFVNHRRYIMNELNTAKNLDSDLHPQESIESTTYINALMERSVSKISKFSDNVWDFNSDYPNAAQNVKGAKLRINFLKYKNIPKFVLTELKIILELALLNNLIFRPKLNSRKNSKKGTLKVNSLIPIFEKGLTFINQIFIQISQELGYEFVQTQIKTLSEVNTEHYHEAAKKYEYVKGRELDQFFEYLRSPSAVKYVFDKPLAYVELNSLNWRKLPSTEKKNKEKVLPDNVFENLSKIASLIVVDFLNATGQKSKILDINSLEALYSSKYSSWANQVRVNHEILNAYIALRLRNKGYSSSSVLSIIEPYDWMLNKNGLACGLTLRKALTSRNYQLDKLREYFNLVSYSCVYLVAQYTGMRPSELAEVKVQDCSCLVEEHEVWLIKSTVKKHQQEINTGLFDDKWVAIPIVRDAILAASYIAKIKSSPYLISNMDTVSSSNSPIPMGSTGITHQMNNFIVKILDATVANQIKFYPYMLRHTLTYQLFRAEVGLPLISFQLKHFVDSVSKFTSLGATSSVTLGYGEIGEMLSKDGSRTGNKSLRRSAELEAVKTVHNPNGTYYGGRAVEHKTNLIKLFQGYMAEGYTEEEVYEAMADQGMAIVYVGQGICYGNRNEEYDTTLPCIGSLRCNPARCSQAIVTSKHAPKWREVYILNKANLNKPEYAHNREQIQAAIDEAVMVLNSLGEMVEL
ncbi:MULTISPECIES: site-specific integrase [Acinetobacter]|uniref:site-specific integrase n=1 Tax=Acinetobacter TaxID=469 RepID=UPI0015BF44F3|nr:MULTISPECIES: site-specific integrase [Acinetobacter]MBL8283066.1 site-specific integrase [Acinetobacter junii]MCH2016292.1 site-specific integrase [Acinetobacter ursingii]NWK82826.1 site-specific integrase [Acinetobacter sp. SwsAc4]